MKVEEMITANPFGTDELSDLPDVPQLLEMLDRLKHANLSALSPVEVEDFFYKHAIIHSQMYGYHRANDPQKLTVYRVRLNIDTANEDINLVRTFSYPPASLCQSNGRANMKGTSVFYCADDALTAIFESKPKAGDIGYVSVWETRVVNRVVKYGICLPVDLPIGNNWRQSAMEAHAHAEKTAVMYCPAKVVQYATLNQFASKQFVDEVAPYPLTSWLSNNILYGKSKADFLLYPSIVTNTQYCNLAFHPNSADTLLTFKKVVRFKVVEVDCVRGTITLATGRMGELQGSRMEWRNSSKDEISFMTDMTKET